MCTDFLVSVNANAGYVNGRSMEFGDPLNSDLLVVPPGTAFQSSSPRGQGLAWTTQYGYVGLSVLGLPVIVDGINTAGLSVGALWLPGTEYPSVTDDACAVSVEYVVGWALGNYSTTDQVQAALTGSGVEVWATAAMAAQLPLHFAVHDAGGHSLVVEFVGGQVQTYANAVGVLTNDPPFPDQLTNLGSYTGLTPWDAQPVAIGGQTFTQPGHGSGMMGLPGDSTPPSRFVRATYLNQYATPPSDPAGAAALAFHLLDDVDIPLGTSRAYNQKDKEVDDYTQWVVVKDLTDQIMYVRFYDNPCVYSVDLAALDFSTATTAPFPVPTTPISIDLTSQLEGSS
jgi:choloylglycine hydrolase